MGARGFFGIAVLFIIGIVGLNSVYIVQETKQAMVLRFGRVDRLNAEAGLHFKLPFIQQVLYFDKRILQTDSSPEEMQTVDKKRVVVDSFTRWRIVDAKKFYEAVRTTTTAVQRVNAIVNSNLRRVVARETLEELVSGDRSRLMQAIEDAATNEANPFGVEIVDVRIKRADLPEENSRAIYNRMRTEREKEAKEIRTEAEKRATILLAEADRDAQKLRGEGDGEAIRITANAFNKDPEFFSLLRSLEAYEKSLKGEDTLLILDPSIEFLQKLKQK